MWSGQLYTTKLSETEYVWGYVFICCVFSGKWRQHYKCRFIIRPLNIIYVLDVPIKRNKNNIHTSGCCPNKLKIANKLPISMQLKLCSWKLNQHLTIIRFTGFRSIIQFCTYIYFMPFKREIDAHLPKYKNKYVFNFIILIF